MEFAKIGVKVVDEGALPRLFNLVVESRLLAWIKAARVENHECTKIKQLLRHKAFALRMLGCSPMSVSEGEGLRKDIMSKTIILSILYILEVPRCTRMRRGQN
jgi:hypothetical protein